MADNGKQVPTETTDPMDLSPPIRTQERYPDTFFNQNVELYGNQSHLILPYPPQFHPEPPHQANQQSQQSFPQHPFMFLPHHFFGYPYAANPRPIQPFNFSSNSGMNQQPITSQSYNHGQPGSNSNYVPVVTEKIDQIDLRSSSNYNHLKSSHNLSMTKTISSDLKSSMTQNITTSESGIPGKNDDSKRNLTENELLKICQQKASVDNGSSRPYRRRNFNCRNNCAKCQDYCQRDCVKCRFIENLDKLL